MPTSVRLTAILERKHPGLPRFVVVPGAAVAAWRLDHTTVIEGTLNDVEMGRRSLKRWDDNWFIDVPEPLCRRASVDTGSRVHLTLRIAPDRLPEELTRLIAKDRTARIAWERLTPSQKRMLREHIAAAKQRRTRERRASRALC